MKLGNYIRNLTIHGNGWDYTVSVRARDDEAMTVAQKSLMDFTLSLCDCAEKRRQDFLSLLRETQGGSSE